jgi:2,3-dihydroxybenzoate decarboxylase
MNKTVQYYFQNNIYETTTGNFATDLMEYHAARIGWEHILYSIDYPFITFKQGTDWLKTLTYSEQALLDLTRNRAIKLLKLDLKQA